MKPKHYALGLLIGNSIGAVFLPSPAYTIATLGLGLGIILAFKGGDWT